MATTPDPSSKALAPGHGGDSLQALRAAARGALRERHIWFYGMLGASNLDRLRGGQQVVLRHTHILRTAGVECHAVRSQGPILRRIPLLGDRLPSTVDARVRPVVVPEHRFLRKLRPDRDVVVVPGRFLGRLDRIPGKHKVVFSQGVFVTMKSLGLIRRERNPWSAPDLRAVLCVSEGNADVVRLAEPRCPVLVVANAVDPSLFAATEKRRLIVSNGLASGCEKNPEDTASVVQILFARGAHGRREKFEVTPLEGVSHTRVRQLLGEARVLLFLSTHEGMPLLALEAMLSGALVLAFRRPPMTEFIPPRCLFEFGDLEGLVHAAEEVLERPEAWQEEIEEGHRIAMQFGPERQERSVLKAWMDIAAELA